MKSKHEKTVFSIIAVLLFIFMAPAYADHDLSDNITGQAFSDPAVIQEMPPEWVKQPVVHEPPAGDADLVLTIDQRRYGAFLPLIEKYGKEHKIKIVVHEGTCGIASGMLSRKTADVGGFCCPPGKTDRLPGLRFHTVGIDAKAILVHPENPIDNITLK